MGNCHPEKPMSTEAKPRLTLVFEGWEFPMLPSRAVNIYHIILNVNSIHRLHYIRFQNNQGQMNIWVCISYSVNSNAHRTPVRIYSELYAHKFCAVDIFLEYQPSSSNITRCQVQSRVRAWFHDSADDIDFYQMSLRQSESTILHESIIEYNMMPW